MSYTDTREPGVYVYVEDRSYVAPAIEIGRSVYCVGLCDKGPHNRIVKITSHDEFVDTFGAPNIAKTSMSHYVMDKAMQFTGIGYYVRCMPEDSTIANVSIREESAPITPLGNSDSFTFTELTMSAPRAKDYDPFSPTNPYVPTPGSTAKNDYELALEVYESAYEAASTIICKDEASYNLFSIGDFIYSSDPMDESDNARQIINKTYTSGVYKFILDSPYTSDITGWVTKSTAAYRFTPYKSTSSILPWDTNLLELHPTIRSQYESAEYLPTVDNDVVYSFYATGAGSYYNDIKIKGVRNESLEKMYVWGSDIKDLDGNIVHKAGDVKYKFLFMNIAVYKTTPEGTDKLLEGPWVVSLTRKNAEGTMIRNLSNGDPLYIQDVINKNSKLVRMVAGAASQKLCLPEVAGSEVNLIESEQRRARIQLMMSVGTPVSTSYYVPQGNALQFANGDDGTVDTNGFTKLYSNTGNLQQDMKIWGLVKQCYQGTFTGMPGIEGSGKISDMRECVYPLYLPDKL